MLDASKPLLIYHAHEVPELAAENAINRAVSALPTGMEKEEETEKHLQDILEAQNKGLVKKVAELVIPCPEVDDVREVEDVRYEEVYTGAFKQPRQYIHVQPFGADHDMPDYDMDEEDEKFFDDELIERKKFDVSKITFEDMIDRLEKNSGQTVVSLREAKMLLKEDDDLILAVYDYWLNKRLETQEPLITTVKTEVRDGTTGGSHNPYIAFRRRTEKMQTRKNRKNDEVSYEKMLKLRRDLNRAVMLLELVKRREKLKKEKLVQYLDIFDNRYKAQDFSGTLYNEVNSVKQWRVLQPQYNNLPAWNSSVGSAGSPQEGNTINVIKKEKRKYKKKRHLSSRPLMPFRSDRPALLTAMLSEPISSDDDRSLSSVDARQSRQEDMEQDENVEVEGPFSFRRRAGVQYHAPVDDGAWPWEGADSKFEYRVAAVADTYGGKERCIGYSSRRVGRGGRIVVDRLTSRWDHLWREEGLDLSQDPFMVRPVTPDNIRDEWDPYRARDVEACHEL